MEPVSSSSSPTHLELVFRKVESFQDMVSRTAVHAQFQKQHNVLELSELHLCMDKLADVQTKLEELRKSLAGSTSTYTNVEPLVAQLQMVNQDLSAIFKQFGTAQLDDLVQVCLGSQAKLTQSDHEVRTLHWLKQYFHPTSYAIVPPILDANVTARKNRRPSHSPQPLTCQRPVELWRGLYAKVHGLQIQLHSATTRQTLAVSGIVDPVPPCLVPNFLETFNYQTLCERLPETLNAQPGVFAQYLASLSLAEWLTLDPRQPADVYQKFAGIQTHVKLLKQKPIASLVKEFLVEDFFQKRNIILFLQLFSQGNENEYLSYLLYDMLSSDTEGQVDTKEQQALFDSLPWSIKKQFKSAMKRTVQFSQDVSTIQFDVQKIPMEQQIALMKVSDTVKDKAMQKWKEVKTKTDDTGSKARQYLEGLLKIPFGTYRQEPVLLEMAQLKDLFLMACPARAGTTVTSADIAALLQQPSLQATSSLRPTQAYIPVDVRSWNKEKLLHSCKHCNTAAVTRRYLDPHVIVKPYTLKKEELVESLTNFVGVCLAATTDPDMHVTLQQHGLVVQQETTLPEENVVVSPPPTLAEKWTHLQEYMRTVRQTLDKAVHGHDLAKKQLERILAQWINGEQSGYCFGFEGPPGVGKTSLAKAGLAHCLVDAQGQPRPFAMLQMGGDSNGSTLHGHNYTYVGSTWGAIVQILMDKKCMNPIIFIDEVDKISKTEHGREITGILTHLLDPAQNDSFQDKYFAGVDLDLSKALFILSYNDVTAIDRVLLDRIHRVKFTHLSLQEKLTICRRHLLPEILQKMGLPDRVQFDDEVLVFLIDQYTCESGVRKLKELLFEIVGEINLQILQHPEQLSGSTTFCPTISAIQDQFLKTRSPVRIQRVSATPQPGCINGLWANLVGQGGIIPIQVSWRPSHQFLSLQLTGTQGDTMKESMHVALTLAWERTPSQRAIELEASHGKCGLHVHCPDTSTPKDGPSAGAAITCALYSLLNNRRIHTHMAVTGEICLTGQVTEIGGLDLKILGGAKAGVTTFLYPEANQRDLNLFLEKHQTDPAIQGLTFHAVTTLDQVLDRMLM